MALVILVTYIIWGFFFLPHTHPKSWILTQRSRPPSWSGDAFLRFHTTLQLWSPGALSSSIPPVPPSSSRNQFRFSLPLSLPHPRFVHSTFFRVCISHTEDMEQQLQALPALALPKLVGRVEVCDIERLRQKAQERSATYKAKDNSIGVHPVSKEWRKRGECAMARFKELS